MLWVRWLKKPENSKQCLHDTETAEALDAGRCAILVSSWYDTTGWPMEGSQALDKTIRSPNDDLGRQKVKQSKQNDRRVCIECIELFF